MSVKDLSHNAFSSLEGVPSRRNSQVEGDPQPLRHPQRVLGTASPGLLNPSPLEATFSGVLPNTPNFRENYYRVWAHLALVAIHSVGACFLFLQPLSFNIFAIFAVAGVYYACLTIDEYVTNCARPGAHTYEKLIAATLFLAVANAFIALRYLALLSSSPFYCLALVFVSVGTGAVNYSRFWKLQALQDNLLNPR